MRIKGSEVASDETTYDEIGISLSPGHPLPLVGAQIRDLAETVSPRTTE